MTTKVASKKKTKPNIRMIGPQSGPQMQFFETSADIAIYGGAAGGGKSWALLIEPLRHKKNADFGAVIFRRTFKQVMNTGGLWDEAGKIYPLVGGEPKKGDHKYIFPTGSNVVFSHLQHEDSIYDWQGSQIPLIGWDELTHFSEKQFFYLMSRNRSMCGVRPYARASCNPDADSWVAKFIDWWIGEDGYPITERAGKVRWFIRKSGVLVWADSKEELQTEHGANVRPKSVTFIPASLSDNKILEDADPDYRANLEAQDHVDRERLLEGNWKVRAEAGKVFNRGWFHVTDDIPKAGVDVRFWDLAATEKKLEGDDPDYTASVRMRFYDDKVFVLDVTDVQASPADVEAMMDEISFQDWKECQQIGIPYMVRWEQEPASAGKRENWRMTTRLSRYDAAGIPPQGDKITRAKPYASQARVGNVYLKKAFWNDHYLQHMHNQPDWPHDDIMDASSGAYTAGQDASTDGILAAAFG